MSITNLEQVPQIYQEPIKSYDWDIEIKEYTWEVHDITHLILSNKSWWNNDDNPEVDSPPNLDWYSVDSFRKEIRDISSKLKLPKNAWQLFLEIKKSFRRWRLENGSRK